MDGIYIQGSLAFVHGNSHFDVMYEGKEHFLCIPLDIYIREAGW